MLTGRLDRDYLKSVPKSGYYYDCMLDAEEAKMAQQLQTLSPRERGKQYANQSMKASIRVSSAVSRKSPSPTLEIMPESRAGAGSASPAASRMASAAVPRPAMPSLGLDAGWDGFPDKPVPNHDHTCILITRCDLFGGVWVCLCVCVYVCVWWGWSAYSQKCQCSCRGVGVRWQASSAVYADVRARTPI